MASTGTEREEPHVPLDELRHPESAFRESQKWIEEVTGKSFGEKDFRSGLENGILLCELLCSIRPGLVQKINRLPSPIAGLDNLSVFLRGCEELGLKGSQLFNPGDLQDTSIQANLRDSECSRKLKNDGEHGSLPQPILEEGGGGEGGGPFKRPPGPRSRNHKTVTWAPDGEEPKGEEGGLGQEEEVLKREVEEHRRLQRLEKAGIKVLPAVIRYGRSAGMWRVGLWRVA
ncbi:LIM and calponin homology domains-containing protein 1-like [Oncorhynchus keta]|uniref:LIM and calponin homology domains-containing protein 1-like n=1 Tax=Oncorhynchus keta TaxID=8018 RepID=UPI00227B72E5|nr:LIM and calponin homology domains-containing protein 1-like [Oncorhynchus keta]